MDEPAWDDNKEGAEGEAMTMTRRSLVRVVVAAIYKDPPRCPHCGNYLSAEDAAAARKPSWNNHPRGTRSLRGLSVDSGLDVRRRPALHPRTATHGPPNGWMGESILAWYYGE